MKKTSKIAMLSLGALLILGFNGTGVSAQECYGPDTMYNEGPTEKCQKRAGKVLATHDTTAMLEEGIAIPGQEMEHNLINSTLVQNALNMHGDMLSEGIIIGSIETDILALRDNVRHIEPAAGR